MVVSSSCSSRHQRGEVRPRDELNRTAHGSAIDLLEVNRKKVTLRDGWHSRPGATPKAGPPVPQRVTIKKPLASAQMLAIVTNPSEADRGNATRAGFAV